MAKNRKSRPTAPLPEDNLTLPPLPTLRPRNPLALAPLMRRGGAHGPERRAVRRSFRRADQQTLRQWVCHQEVDED